MQYPNDGGRAPALEQSGAAVSASASIGAALAATIGAACCSGPMLGPTVIAILGASGAASAAGLKPYAPYLFAVSFLMLTMSFWLAYKPYRICDPPAQATARWPRRVARIVSWTSAAIWIVAIAFTLVSLRKL